MGAFQAITVCASIRCLPAYRKSYHVESAADAYRNSYHVESASDAYRNSYHVESASDAYRNSYHVESALDAYRNSYHKDSVSYAYRNGYRMESEPSTTYTLVYNDLRVASSLIIKLRNEMSAFASLCRIFISLF